MRAVRVCLVAVPVLVSMAACGGGGAKPPAPLPPVASGGSTGGSPGTAVTGPGGSSGATSRPAPILGDPLAVYRAWWGAVEAALATADPNYPALKAYGRSPLLTRMQAGIVALRSQGLVQVVHYTLTPQVVAQTDTQVEIADCIRGPAGTYRDARTGQPRAPSGFRNDTPSRDSLRFVLQLLGGSWYLISASSSGGGPC